MCLNTRFIGIMNDLSDNSCYVDDICDVQVVCRGRQRSFERLTPLKNLSMITLNSSEDFDFLSQMFLK